MVVYDVTREKTFQAVTKWKADIDENLSVDGISIPCVLLANKVLFTIYIHIYFLFKKLYQCDLAEQPINKEILDKFCKENGFVAWLIK